MYNLEINSKTIKINELIKYYNIKKVEGYCSNCINYKKIWSCPPHDFNSLNYLRKYKYVQVISVKIVFNKDKLNEDYKAHMSDIFQEVRRKFGNYLISLEENSEALIAGNCYQCTVCKREINQACILSSKRRYSVESLGLMVSDITENILNQEIQWVKEGIPDYYLTVGALLLKENKPIKKFSFE